MGVDWHSLRQPANKHAFSGDAFVVYDPLAGVKWSPGRRDPAMGIKSYGAVRGDFSSEIYARFGRLFYHP